MYNWLWFVAYPLGQLLNGIYNTVALHRYGIALIIFTIIIRAILLPLMIKQYHSTAKMQEIQPQIQEIQKRYKNDKEKLNAELMRVYSENKVNPAGGCLPLLIQMPILLALWQVISKPLTYMLSWNSQKITEYVNTLKIPKVAYPELEIVNRYVDSAGRKLIDMNFLGLNLGTTPTWHPQTLISQPIYIALLMLPIIATATTYISSKMSMAATMQNNASGSAAGMQNSMLLVGPLMTLMFSFGFPAGLSLYWITGNIFMIFQQMYINKYVLKKKKEVANK